jgi:hypothetical protein
MSRKGPYRTGYFIWVERGWLNELEALRQPGEGLSETIIRLVAMEAGGPYPSLTLAVPLRVTDEPPESPEEGEVIERQIRRKQFRKFLIFIVVVLGFMLAAYAATKKWGSVGPY